MCFCLKVVMSPLLWCPLYYHALFCVSIIYPYLCMHHGGWVNLCFIYRIWCFINSTHFSTKWVEYLLHFKRKHWEISSNNSRNHNLTIAWIYFLIFIQYYESSLKIYRNKKEHWRQNVYVLNIIPNAVGK